MDTKESAAKVSETIVKKLLDIRCHGIKGCLRREIKASNRLVRACNGALLPCSADNGGAVPMGPTDIIQGEKVVGLIYVPPFDASAGPKAAESRNTAAPSSGRKSRLAQVPCARG